jgi:hypothetical protein
MPNRAYIDGAGPDLNRVTSVRRGAVGSVETSRSTEALLSRDPRRQIDRIRVCDFAQYLREFFPIFPSVPDIVDRD